ncbi:hypothetical protein D3C75_658580 [compost metagenome]
MHGTDAGLAQLEFNPEIEVRSVDADEHVRTLVDQGADQSAPTTEQFGQAAEHLDQAHHRQALHWEVRVQPLGLHAWTADADELHIRVTCLDGLHQSGAEDIAGRFAGDQGDLQCTRHGFSG